MPRLVSTLAAVIALCLAAPLSAQTDAAAAPQPPFEYVVGKAYHILPETTTDESGYSSLCEGLNGRIYVGTAAYGRNAYLVEFDPETEQQRIVIDMHQLLGESASGMKAQSKIHTRNYVAPSGTIYVGSKQGYPKKGENPFDYPGGHIATYDPETDEAKIIASVPFRAHGVIDVIADEDRGLLYVCTQDDRNRQSLWMLHDMNSGAWRGLYSNLTFYGLTLLDKTGGAHAITDRNEIVSHHLATDELRVRPMVLDGARFVNEPGGHDGHRGVPEWIIAPDGRTAYLIYMSEPMLYSVDLLQEGDEMKIERVATLLDVDRSDCRTGLTMGPDGAVYALLRVRNETGFGGRNIHHLTRYDPTTGEAADLGVLKIANPDFYGRELTARGAHDDQGERIPWTHGYHVLPDGTLTPTVVHQSLVATREGGLYATLLYPFTLLRIEPQTVREAMAD